MTLLCVQILLQLMIRSAVERAGDRAWNRHQLRDRHPPCDVPGMPIAFALGAVAVVFMGIYASASLDTATQNVYEEMARLRCCRSRFSF
jgi:hypothetical protein